MIHCDQHGESPGCIICRHLCEGRGLGYWTIRPDAEGPAQAWCEECDAVLEADRGWTDRGDALANWQVSCSQCYARTLSRHTRRGWDAGGRTKAQ